MMGNTNETIADIARELREDAANLSSCDGVDAQIDELKRLARTRVGGHECAMPCSEFADIVERLDAARKRELASPGNAAAMRLCDELIQAAYDADICSPGDLARRVRKIQAALSAPARNADRFVNPGEAWIAYKAECDKNETVPNMVGAISWLFAPAEGGEE